MKLLWIEARQYFAQVAQGWDQFWFDSDGRAQIRLFRITFGALLFVCYLIRSLDLELFYSDQGIMTLRALPELVSPEFRFSVFHYFTSLSALWIGNWVFLGSLLSFTLGIFPRPSVLVALVLHVSFIHRNLSVTYGTDLVACFLLFFLCFADYREDREYRRGDLRATLGSMAFRLCQVQVCVIYGYSGLKKLKGTLWWNGDAMWSSLADPQLARWDFSWLSHFPLLLAGVTFLTLAWEIYFPAAVWNRRLRTPYLILGVFLHLGIAVGLNLPFFGGLMILTYLFFLDRAVVDRGTAVGLAFPQAVKKMITLSKVPRPVSD